MKGKGRREKRREREGERDEKGKDSGWKLKNSLPWQKEKGVGMACLLETKQS